MWPRYLSPSQVVISIYRGNWVWTEVITVLVSQDNISLMRRVLSMLRQSEDNRQSKSADVRSSFLFPSPKTWWRTFQSNNQMQIFQTFYTVMKMKASYNSNSNLVKLSARAQSNFRNFTPIWGRRKIQEDGRWRRRGSHAILHIFNHCHLAKYCDVYVCNLVCFLIYFPNSNIK